MIAFIRLTNGEDLIGEIVEMDDLSTFVRDPHRAVYIPGKKPGSVNVSLIEWVLPELVDTDVFEISCDQIITMSEVKPAIEEYYNRATKALKDLRQKLPKTPSIEEPTATNSNQLDFDSDLIDELSGIGDLDYVKEMLDEIQQKAKKNKGPLH